jgi:hypothetical protein
MEARPAFAGAVALLLVAACSGSAAPPIPEDPGPPHADMAPSSPPPDPANGSSDERARGSDASVRDAASEDAGNVSACEACIASGCRPERDACLADAGCKALSACLDACKDSACRNACFTKYPDPGAKAKNGVLYKCQCITACATACAVECR